MTNEKGNTNQSVSADIVAAPQGFFQSLSNSFGSILVGLVFILVACWGLWVNEGRAVKTARALAEEQVLVQAIGTDRVDSAMNGRLVHVSGDVRSQWGFSDETFKLLASFIPVLGSLVSGATALIAATATAILGSLVFALAWFAYRQMTSIVVMALGFAIAFGFRTIRLKRKTPIHRAASSLKEFIYMKTLIHSFAQDRLRLARMAAVLIGLSLAVPVPAFAFDASAAIARLTELGVKVGNQPINTENLGKVFFFSGGNHSKKLTDADMAMLASLPGLRTVDLSSTDNVTPEGIKALAASQSIRTLTLSTVNVGDIGAAAIGNMAQLESLSLDSVKGMTSASAPAIAGLKQLSQLQLSEVPFDDAALAHFAKHPKLGVVGLTRMKTVSDVGIAHFGTVPNIRALDLRSTPVTGKFVDAFANSRNLTEISAMGANLNDADMRGIGRLKNIQRLDLRSNTGIGDATLAEMAKMPTIRVALLEKTGITDKGLSAIGKLPNLAELVISETAVTDAGIAPLQLPKLTLIAIQGTKITDATVEKFASHATLTRLVIHKTAATKDGIAKALANRPANLPRLSIEN